MCEEGDGGVSNPDELLKFFDRTGVVLHKPGLFRDDIVIDREWALNAIYTLLDRAKTMPALREHGRFTRYDLELLVWKERGYSVAEQNLFLGLMESCGICFKARRIEGGDWQYIAPDLLPEWGRAQRELLGWVPEDAAVVRVEVRYRFWHEGVVRRFQSRIGSVAGDAASYWKYGCRFYEQTTGSKVLVTSEARSATGTGRTGVLIFQAWGKSPQALVEKLLRIVEETQVGQPPEVVRLTAPSPNVSSAEPDECDQPMIVPRRAEMIDDNRRKVYISYAWGNASAGDVESRRREDTVDALCAVLKSQGYLVIRDKEWMRKGDLIADFMREIGRGNCILTILSAKYLQSEYCMTELNHIFSASLGQDDDYRRRMVPVVLPDAKIYEPEDRDAVAEFWEKRARYFAPRAEQAKLSQDEFALFKTIRSWDFRLRDMLGPIVQILHIYTFEEMIADDFRAVRELLDRRFAEAETPTRP